MHGGDSVAPLSKYASSSKAEPVARSPLPSTLLSPPPLRTPQLQQQALQPSELQRKHASEQMTLHDRSNPREKWSGWQTSRSRDHQQVIRVKERSNKSADSRASGGSPTRHPTQPRRALPEPPPQRAWRRRNPQNATFERSSPGGECSLRQACQRRGVEVLR
jgi:hypothetical protein